MILRSFLPAFCLFTAAAALSSCGPSGGHNAEGGAWKKGDKAVEAIPVKVEALGRGVVSQKLLTSSTVEAVRRVDLVAKASGIVKEIVVVEGAEVAAGAVVAKLEDEELLLARKKAEVNALKSRADLEHSTTLLKEKFISVDEHRKTEQATRTAELELETAELALAQATIRAPIAGTMTRLDLQKGRYVAANAAIGELTDLTELECTIFIPEKDVLRLAEGQAAEVASESLKATYGAKVKRVNAVIDKASGTARSVLSLENKDGRLRPGMFVDVAIVVEAHDGAVLVPKKALVYDEGLAGVFILDGETVKWSELTLGFQEKDVAEVLKGAKEGDRIVVAGQNGLKSGAKVRVLTE